MTAVAPDTLINGTVLSELCEKLPILPAEKFLAAVALLAPIAEREDVTDVLRQARPRLRELKPERPRTAKRLLCLPFEDLFCAAVHDAGEARIGRGAIEPLWDLLADRIPKRLAALERTVRALPSRDYRDQRRVAQSIWQEAAAVLGSAVPADHPHRATFALMHDALKAADAIEDFKSAFCDKPMIALRPDTESAIVGTADRLRGDRGALEAFLLVVSARLANPGALLTLIEAHDLPSPAALVQRIEAVAVAQLTDRAAQFTGQTAALSPETLATEAEALFRDIAETKQAVGPKSRAALDVGTAALKEATRSAISDQVIAKTATAVSPAFDDEPSADALEAAEAHARALNRSRRLAPAVGLGDAADQAGAALRTRLDERVAACIDRSAAAAGEGKHAAKAALYRAIRMIEMLDGSAAANLIMRQIRPRPSA